MAVLRQARATLRINCAHVVRKFAPAPVSNHSRRLLWCIYLRHSIRFRWSLAWHSVHLLRSLVCIAWSISTHCLLLRLLLAFKFREFGPTCLDALSRRFHDQICHLWVF